MGLSGRGCLREKTFAKTPCQRNCSVSQTDLKFKTSIWMSCPGFRSHLITLRLSLPRNEKQHLDKINIFVYYFTLHILFPNRTQLVICKKGKKKTISKKLNLSVSKARTAIEAIWHRSPCSNMSSPDYWTAPDGGMKTEVVSAGLLVEWWITS
jgi:hypothetical protein